MGAIFETIGDAASFVMDTQARREAFDVNSRELDKAAAAADRQAVSSLTRGAEGVGMARRQGSMVAGQQRLALAVNGVEGTTGTAAKLQEASAAAAERDAEVTRANALAEALGHKQVASQYRGEKARQSREMDNAYTSGYFGLMGKTLARAANFGMGGAGGGSFFGMGGGGK